MKVSIVIATYNEEAYVGAVIPAVLALTFPGLEKEVIVVNDGSKDRTAEVIAPFAGRVTIITHKVNRGKGEALKSGFTAASGDIIAIQDADLEYDPDDLLKLVMPIARGEADVTYGSRQLQDNPRGIPVFYLGNRGINLVFNILYGSALTDIYTATKVFKKSVWHEMHLTENGFGFEAEFTAQALKHHHAIVEYPVSYKPRSIAEGKKIRWHDGIRFLMVAVRERFSGKRD
jgi:glycosyltransferase involved in cell wall biosynthesis